MRLQTDPISLSLAPDVPVLLFTTAVALLTGLLFGLPPAFRSGRADIAAALKGNAVNLAGATGRQWSLQVLVVAQVGLSLMLLVGAGLFVRTLQQLKGLDAGFKRENVVLFNLDFADRPETARWSAFYRELLGRLEALPGVRTASLFNFGFLSGSFWTDRILAEGYQAEPGENLECAGVLVGRRFFETFGMSFLSGRDFGLQDERPVASTNATVASTAVVNQSMAHRYFGDANPLGKRFYFAHQPEKKFEIVGVVADAKLIRCGRCGTSEYPQHQDPNWWEDFNLFCGQRLTRAETRVRGGTNDLERHSERRRQPQKCFTPRGAIPRLAPS